MLFFKLCRYLLTVIDSGGIAATLVSLFSDSGGFLSCIKANDTLNTA